MPHILINPDRFIGKPKIGDGSCVTLIRSTVDTLRDVPTKNWIQGQRVQDSKGLVKGTVIATFFCGHYPQDGQTGKHAAIFLRYWGPPNPDGTYNAVLVLDQWPSRVAMMTRDLHKKGTKDIACTGSHRASNELDEMYVVETLSRRK